MKEKQDEMDKKNETDKNKMKRDKTR